MPVIKLFLPSGDCHRIVIQDKKDYTDIITKVRQMISSDVFRLKYKDDEGDMVTIESEEELEIAFSTVEEQTLKLFLEDIEEESKQGIPVIEIIADQKEGESLSDVPTPNAVYVESVRSESSEPLIVDAEEFGSQSFIDIKELEIVEKNGDDISPKGWSPDFKVDGEAEFVVPLVIPQKDENQSTRASSVSKNSPVMIGADISPLKVSPVMVNGNDQAREHFDPKVPTGPALPVGDESSVEERDGEVLTPSWASVLRASGIGMEDVSEPAQNMEAGKVKKNSKAEEENIEATDKGNEVAEKISDESTSVEKESNESKRDLSVERESGVEKAFEKLILDNLDTLLKSYSNKDEDAVLVFCVKPNKLKKALTNGCFKNVKTSDAKGSEPEQVGTLKKDEKSAAQQQAKAFDNNIYDRKLQTNKETKGDTGKGSEPEQVAILKKDEKSAAQQQAKAFDNKVHDRKLQTKKETKGNTGKEAKAELVNALDRHAEAKSLNLSLLVGQGNYIKWKFEGGIPSIKFFKNGGVTSSKYTFEKGDRLVRINERWIQHLSRNEVEELWLAENGGGKDTRLYFQSLDQVHVCERFHEKIKILQAMGFLNVRKNRCILEEEDGNTEVAIEKLLVSS
eukprot:CAMPEP_0184481140 /NCGR_PEP_ID=MMETSP0113_2-20130426/2676_1 /TAXON_ID=91329 /ORGANISM="Norrisiella sphaerica, Strain BC52" /LENGTH=623 /DNA_ID=CAMNT_0026860071 /DNA_START=48 /DNA_END=1919 /DNA_ORIENTATION=-